MLYDSISIPIKWNKTWEKHTKLFGATSFCVQCMCQTNFIFNGVLCSSAVAVVIEM